MGTETEIKIQIDDPQAFVQTLAAMHARTESARHFEDNHLLDFTDQRLKSGQCLIRIRFAEDLPRVCRKRGWTFLASLKSVEWTRGVTPSLFQFADGAKLQACKRTQESM